MKALVVYDSVFGNTEQVARAIAGALPSQEEVQLCRVSEVKPEQLAGVKLLVVGSPTRGFKPTPAITAFLQNLPANALSGVKVAAFDTRADVKKINSAILKFFVSVFGYAAGRIAKLLKRKGGALADPGAGFVVVDTEGPLLEGELDRAAAWARSVAA